MSNKTDYTKFSEEKLKKRKKDLNLEMIKAQCGQGKAKVDKKDKSSNVSTGSDILKRLRREIARINTEISRRKNE